MVGDGPTAAFVGEAEDLTMLDKVKLAKGL